MTSIAISPYTMAAALFAAGNVLGRPQWQGNPENKTQMEWLERYAQRATEGTTISEIQSNATEVFDNHNLWLKRHGWESDLKPGMPGDLYLAAILAIGGKWKTAGKARVENNTHRALVDEVHLRGDIAVIPTTQNDVSFVLRQVAEPIVDAKTLHQLGVTTWEMVTSRYTRSQVGEVDFPMVDLKLSSSAEYMLGIRSGENTINQAAEGFELKMNHLGGLARAKAELGMTRGLPPAKPRITITGPFIAAVVKQGVQEPVFVAYCDRDSWKNPGEF